MKMSDRDLRAEIESLQRQVNTLKQNLAASAHGGGGGSADDAFYRNLIDLLTDALPISIAYIDAGLIVGYANKGLANRYGYEPEEAIGMHMQELRGEDNFERSRPYYEMALGGREVVYESYSILMDGTRFDYQSTYLPQFGADGVVLGLFAVVFVFSERKLVEAAFKESVER